MAAGGRYFHGEYHTDSGTGGALTLSDENGNALTLASNQRLVIHVAQLIVSASGQATLYFDNDAGSDIDTGERVIAGNVAANGGVVIEFQSCPRIGKPGIGLTCAGSSGAITAIVDGFIQNV